uniref:Uncharacterized protein n=1 Tax=Physcomitrium patens TaxID=3218 RepID=A0A7I4B151_PHYPA
MLPTRYTTWSIRRISFLGHFLSLLVRGDTLIRGDAIFGLYVEPSGDPYMSLERGDGGKGSLGPYLDMMGLESDSAIPQVSNDKSRRASRDESIVTSRPYPASATIRPRPSPLCYRGHLTYGCHKGGVNSLHFRPHMKHVVSGGADSVVLLWSLHCRPNLRHPVVRPYRFLGHQVIILPQRFENFSFEKIGTDTGCRNAPSISDRTGYPPMGPVYSVAVSPLDNLVASGSKDKTVRLWLPTVEAKSSVIKAHGGAVRTVAFSHDGQCLLSGSDDKTIKIWMVQGQKFLSTLIGHINWVRSAEFSPDNSADVSSVIGCRRIVSGSDDRTVRLWDLERHECIQQFNDGMGLINSVRFHPNGCLLGTGGSDNCVQVFQCLPSMSSNLQHQYHAQFTQICTANYLHGLFITFDFNNPFLRFTIKSQERLYDCKYVANIKPSFAEVYFYSIYEWIGGLLYHYAANGGIVNSVCFHPSGNFLLSTCEDSTIRVWDLREGQILYSLQGHEGATLCAEFSPTGEYFASGSADEHVMLWRTNFDDSICLPEGTLGD